MFSFLINFLLLFVSLIDQRSTRPDHVSIYTRSESLFVQCFSFSLVEIVPKSFLIDRIVNNGIISNGMAERTNERNAYYFELICREGNFCFLKTKGLGRVLGSAHAPIMRWSFVRRIPSSCGDNRWTFDIRGHFSSNHRH